MTSLMNLWTSSKGLNKLRKSVIDMERQCLTPPESATIIATLCAVEAREKRIARQVVWLQIAATLAVTALAYSLNGTPQLAAAALSGGGISVLNGALLAWRMSRAGLHPAHDTHLQLRLMYFYAAERFLVVVVLLGLCLAVLKLSPLAVLGGFVMGQAALLIARVFLANSKT